MYCLSEMGRSGYNRVEWVLRLEPSENTRTGDTRVTREEIFAKVVEIVRPFAKDKDALASAKLETNILDDLKVNSARLVDVILEFEDEFDIEVEDEDADSVNTIGDAVDLIASKVG